MKVKLINYTMNSLELLLYTKNTRLQGGQSLEEIGMWLELKKREHLAYMRDTIKSSWEFVNYTFEISGVTRAFTHQLVRTRNGRYAQESMRTVDVSGADVKSPDNLNELQQILWDANADRAMFQYQDLLSTGMAPQDARGILPTNVCTSIIAQFSLRTLHEMASVRLCTRTQGEYQDVFRAMKAAVVEVHPWADDFIQVACVNTGVCVFPRYTECPIQEWTLNAERVIHNYADVKATVKEKWEETRHEAVPTAKDGRTM
jgi:flavin-dependent thymidylate synthase